MDQLLKTLFSYLFAICAFISLGMIVSGLVGTLRHWKAYFREKTDQQRRWFSIFKKGLISFLGVFIYYLFSNVIIYFFCGTSLKSLDFPNLSGNTSHSDYTDYSSDYTQYNYTDCSNFQGFFLIMFIVILLFITFYVWRKKRNNKSQPIIQSPPVLEEKKIV